MKSGLKRLTSAFLLLGFLLFSNVDIFTVNAANYTYSKNVFNTQENVYISGLKVPTYINKGDSCSIGGLVNIKNITKSWYIGIMVYSHIYNTCVPDVKYRNRYICASEESTLKPSSQKSYDLKWLDPDIIFGQLPAGEYYYTIYHKIDNDIYEDYTCTLVVTNNATGFTAKTKSGLNAALVNCKVPSTLRYGNSFSLTGHIDLLYDKYKDNSSSIYKTSYPNVMIASVDKINSDKTTTNVTTQTAYLTKDGVQSSQNLFMANSRRNRIINIPKNIDNNIVFGSYKPGIYKLTYRLAWDMNETSCYYSGSYVMAEYNFTIK